jgi:hypothetical protein
MIKLIDPAHPFYQPLWRRVAIVAVCAVWFAVELIMWGDPLFIPIAGALTAYTAWVLLLKWKTPQSP